MSIKDLVLNTLKKIKTFWSIFPKSLKIITPIIIIVVFALDYFTKGDFLLRPLKYSSKTKQSNFLNESSGYQKLQIPQRETPFFTLQPSINSKYGLLPKEALMLSAKEPVDLKIIESNIKSNQNFTISQISDKEYKLTPESPFEIDQSVKISLDVKGVASNSKIFDRNYGWAYQTPGKFRLVSTIPADKAKNVPVNTGIELVFSQDDYKDPSPLLSISPPIEYRTEKHGESWAIVPLKPLENKKVYSVTLKKGLKIDSRDDPIAKDIVLSFQTEEKNISKPRLTVNDYFIQSSTNKIPVIKVYTDDWSQNELVKTEIFQYASGSEFIADVAKTNKANDYWYQYYPEDNLVDTSRLNLAATADLKVLTKEGLSYLQLPDALPSGFYLVQFKYSDKITQVWVQSADIAGYVSVGRIQTLVWVNDIVNNAPVQDVKINVVGAGGDNYTSNEGLTVFDTPSVLHEKGQHYFELESDQRKLYLPVSSLSDKSSQAQPTADDYWSYIYHERNLYKPTDTINYWGVIKNRNTGYPPESLSISLTKNDYESEPKVIENQQISAASDGSFIGSLGFSDLPAGWYNLNVKVGELLVSQAGFHIEDYQKPEMKFEVTGDKKAIFAGEKVDYIGRVSFFDNTPVKNISVKVFEDKKAGEVGNYNSDIKGEVKYTYNSKYTGNFQDYPRFESVTLSPALAQAANTEGSGSVYVYGSKFLLTSKSSQEGRQAKFRAVLNKVDLSNINLGISQEVKGDKVANKEISLSIRKSWWEKVEQGTYYDFIEKVTRPAFNYVEHNEKLLETSLKTDDQGEIAYDFEMEKEKSYEVKARVTDEDNRIEEEIDYFYYYGDQSSYNASQDTTPSLSLGKKENTYSVGQSVDIAIEQNSELYKKANKDRFLFIVAQQGRQDFFIKDSPILSFAFEKKHIPNSNVGAVIFNDKGYRPVSANCKWSWRCDYGDNFFEGLEIRYQKEDSELEVKIENNQDKYNPGEKAQITILVTQKGQPVNSATVNTVLVDQALAAIGGVVSPSILSSLYKSTPNNIYYTYYSHKSPFPDKSMGEMGGGGGGYRQIFKDTALFSQQKTSADGKAVFSFVVPDNITTWITYSQAITDELNAGQAENKLVVSKSFFVTSQFPKEYLEKDSAILAANSFGSELKSDMLIDYQATFYQQNIEKSKLNQSGKAFIDIGFSFPKLEPGEYEAGLKGKTGNFEDGIKLPFKVIDSKTSLPYSKKYEISQGKELRDLEIKGYLQSKPVSLVISDVGRGKFYSQLKNYCYSSSNRVEKSIAKIRANQLLVEKFGDKPCTDGLEIPKWQTQEGGLGQVWWGSSNLESTVWSIFVDKSVFNKEEKERLIAYLKSKLNENVSGISQKIYSLWGLDILGEPMINNIRQLAETNTNYEEKVLLGLALASAGDNEKARDIFYDLMADYAYTSKPYIRIQRDKDKNPINTDKALVDTARALLLGSMVENSYDLSLGLYVRDYQMRAVDVVLDLSQMAYVNEEISKLPSVDTSLSLNTSSGQSTIDLSRGGSSKVISLSPADINVFKLIAISGKAEASVFYSIGSAAISQIPKDERLFIKRSLKKTKGEGDLITTGDIIQISLDFDFKTDSPECCYTITDYLPAGLTYLDNSGLYGLSTKSWVWQEQNNVIKSRICNSYWWRNENPIVYYARAATVGKYFAEPATFQADIDLSIIQATAEDVITIGIAK